MQNTITRVSMENKKSVLKVLAYFEIFHYPLNLKEINSFLDRPLNEAALNTTLDKLLIEKKIYKVDEFYSLQNNPSLIERRKKGNDYATALLTKGYGIGKFLFKFPYVRGIGISGSVSKKFADESADIDYFIITKSNRLWIARTILCLFIKFPFVKNRRRYYCMNYFVDEAGLTIEEKNIYTATELYTLIPVAGNGSLEKFFKHNDWASSYLPNHNVPVIKNEINYPDPWLKKSIEFLFNNKIGNWLDNFLMKLTTKRWKKKEEEKRVNTKGQLMGLKTGKHFSKPNPIFFHDWFMSKYENKLKELFKDR